MGPRFVRGPRALTQVCTSNARSGDGRDMVQYPAIGLRDGAPGGREGHRGEINLPERQTGAAMQARQRVVVLLIVAIGVALASIAHAESVWDALRAPGSVVVLRHSYAPGGFDPPDARLDDCSTQRNLDANGRAQAARVGEAFRRSG